MKRPHDNNSATAVNASSKLTISFDKIHFGSMIWICILLSSDLPALLCFVISNSCYLHYHYRRTNTRTQSTLH